MAGGLWPLLLGAPLFSSCSLSALGSAASVLTARGALRCNLSSSGKTWLMIVQALTTRVTEAPCVWGEAIAVPVP